MVGNAERTLMLPWMKLAALFVLLASGVRLPLGRDTVAVIEKKNAFVARELAEWRRIAESTEFMKQ